MGTDIHLHIEVKVDGAWHHYAQLNPNRNYRMFSAMAGVRDGICLFGEPKGMLDDATRLTRLNFEKWRDDAHHTSWLDLHEIGILESYFDLDVRHQNLTHFEAWIGAYLYGNGFSDIRNSPVDDVRFVFFFDC